jgi:hypothetical protein
MRTGSLLVTAALLLALAGCVPADPHPSASPSASATPVFASDAEALAAAEKAYAAYLKVSDEVGQGGWKDVDSLVPYVRGAALSNDLKTAKDLSSKSLKQVGLTSFDSVKLESLDDRGDGTAVVTMYLCVDVSDVDVISPSGASVVPGSRRTRVPLEVDVDNLKSPTFKVSRSDAWSGTDFC